MTQLNDPLDSNEEWIHPILVTIGVILVIVGLILNFVPIGGTRRRYY